MFVDEEDMLAYRHIRSIEGYLRFIVRWELRFREPRAWLGRFPPEVTRKVTQRKNDERSATGIGTAPDAFFSFLMLGELRSFMCDRLWDDAFAPRLWSKANFEADLGRIMTIRNRVAHFRSISKRDRMHLDAFIEDLRECTKYYDDVYLRARTCSTKEEFASAAAATKLPAQFAVVVQELMGRHCGLNIKLYSKSYVGFGLKHSGAAFDVDDLRNAIAQYAAGVTPYVKISPVADQIEVLVSSGADPAEVSSALTHYLALAESHAGLVPSNMVNEKLLRSFPETAYKLEDRIPSQYRW